VTLTLGPPQVTEPASPEALIREARRLQRRRWRRGAVLVTLLFVVAAVVVTSLQGGGPARPRPTPRTPGPQPQAQRRVNGPSLGLATSYQLTGPIGVAVDRGGDIYFTDANRVLEVDRATQQLQVVAGTGAAGFSGDGGPGPQATLSGPSGVAVAPNGDLYFQDNNRIRKVSAADGVVSTVAGDGRTGPAGDDGHTGSTGDGGPAVRASLDFGSAGSGVGGLSDSIAIGPNGDLYVADTGNNEVQKVSLATGVITRVAGPGIHCGPLDGICQAAPHPCAPVGVAVDSSSNIFVATACGSIREKVAATGVTSTIFSTHQDPALAGTGGDHDPTGLAVGNDKTLFVTEAYGRRLLELNLASGRVVLVAGTGVETFPEPGQTAGDGGPASHASFGLAVGAAVDGQGNVYVADFFNDAVRMIDSRTGVISTVAGQIPQSPAQQGHCC
jgi:sugar lactone lactonase YvrE